MYLTEFQSHFLLTEQVKSETDNFDINNHENLTMTVYIIHTSM